MPSPKKGQPKPAKQGAADPGDSSAEKPAPVSKSKYSAEVRSASREVREVLGPKVKPPGAKQVAAVVKALGSRTPADAAGIPMSRLRKWAEKGERPEDFAKLRELAAQVGDPWATGRKLAAILVAIEAVRKGEGE